MKIDLQRAVEVLDACGYECGEIISLKADAERYRWLRVALSDRSAKGVSHHFCSVRSAAELDDAIDVKIGAAKEKS